MQQIDEEYSDTVKAVRRVRDEMRAQVILAEASLREARAAYNAADIAVIQAELVEDNARRKRAAESK